jgi:hypothetical protein
MSTRGLSASEKAAFVDAAMAQAVNDDKVCCWVLREPWQLLNVLARVDPKPLKSVFQLECGIFDSNPLVQATGRAVFATFVHEVLTESYWQPVAKVLREECPRE